jgi:hypothetical protein
MTAVHALAHCCCDTNFNIILKFTHYVSRMVRYLLAGVQTLILLSVYISSVCARHPVHLTVLNFVRIFGKGHKNVVSLYLNVHIFLLQRPSFTPV